jgi:hypothetical protein
LTKSALTVGAMVTVKTGPGALDAVAGLAAGKLA